MKSQRDGRELLALVCHGSHCRGGAQEELCEALRAAGVEVLPSRCLRVCKGPVAMFPVGNRWQVVARIRGGRARRKVVLALTRQRQRGIRKRSVRGGRRRRAIERGTQAILRRANLHPRLRSVVVRLVSR